MTSLHKKRRKILRGKQTPGALHLPLSLSLSCPYLGALFIHLVGLLELRGPVQGVESLTVNMLPLLLGGHPGHPVDLLLRGLQQHLRGHHSESLIP